ncbi:hypothetical protein Ancab_032289 [Ancistrocladus abbreviatus]
MSIRPTQLFSFMRVWNLTHHMRLQPTYAFYKEYAEFMGFATAKLSSSFAKDRLQGKPACEEKAPMENDAFTNDVQMRRRKMLSAVSKQFSAFQNTECSDYFVRNNPDKGQKLSLQAGDAQVLLELFVSIQEEDPTFFYALALNEEHQL